MADYTFDVQKLYLEMMMADAESFARAQNIFDPNSFDRKLQPIAKFIKDYVEEYKVMPEVEQVNAQHDIKLKTAKDLDPAHFTWLLDEFETFSRHKAMERAILQSADMLERGDYAPVEDMIKAAVGISLTKDIGTDYFEDPKARVGRPWTRSYLVDSIGVNLTFSQVDLVQVNRCSCKILQSTGR
jgi:hypothetical protein